MILQTLKYPNPLLRKRCQEIKEITPQIKQLALDMIDTMIERKGVGLAACQVGKLLRLVAVMAKEGPKIYINPVILKKTKEKEVMEEGCLCFPPDIFLKIKRPKGIEFRALDENGKDVFIKDDTMLARVLQHETDHLDGILIADRAGLWQKFKLMRRLKNAAR